MIQKDGSIIISDFQRGIAKSPILGNGSIVNCNIFEKEGLLKMAQKTTIARTFTASSDTPLPIARINNVEYLDNGKIYNNGTYINDVAVQGLDMIEWKTFYLFSGNGTIWACNKSGFSSGTYIRSGLSSKVYLLKAQDNCVYYTNGSKIGKLTNLVDSGGFLTATYSDNVLDLPTHENATNLVELGNMILIGTESSEINPQNYQQANIYPWDRTSASFNLPVKIEENGIQTMIVKNNLCYVFAGQKGNVYVTNGSSYKLLTRIPYTNNYYRFTSTCKIRKNSVIFSNTDKILVGTSTLTGVTPNTTDLHGIWEIDTSNGTTHLAYTIPTGEYGQNESINIGYIYQYAQALYFSYAKNMYYSGTFASAYTDNGNCSLSSFESPLYIVGDYSNKKTFNELQWTFTTPLQTSQKLLIYYRNGLDSSWTKIFESTNDHIGKYSFLTKALIPSSEILQIKIELANSGSIWTSPELLRVLLK